MWRNVIINTFFLLAVTTHVWAQYVDFFQSFNSFIQPFQTTRRSDVTTKQPATKQTTPRYHDAIFFETDDFLKQRQNGQTMDPYTTVKPKRKNKATTKPTTKSPWYDLAIINNAFNNNFNNQIVNNINGNRRVDNENNRRDGNDNNRRDGNDNNRRDGNDNNRRDGNDNNRRDGNDNNNVYNHVTNAAINIGQTEKPIVFNNNFNVAQKPVSSRPVHNTRTTDNPLLNRPGVRPAVVDDNRPPITNRPVTYTERPTKRPNGVVSEPDINIGPDEDEMSESEKRRYIEIAEQKCDEYKSINTKKVVALPLATVHSSVGVELNVSTCTLINIPLIIGGKVVSIQEYPHMSLVGWKNIQKQGYSWKCGGSLISEQFILTAGHCTYYDKDYNVISGPPQAVQLGSSFIDGQDSLVVSISSLVRHPKYKLRRSYYDVALIKLVSTVRFSATVSPACLGASPSVGNRIIVTGWGRTEFGGDSSPELRSVSVPIWEMGQCREVWGTSRKLPEGPSPASQLCAGERGGGKDTCQGDSGGPAQIQDGCSWRVVAVTSVGRSCGAAETPALYAKLPRAFIASQVFADVKVSNNQNNNVLGNNNSGNRNNVGVTSGFNQGVVNGNNNSGNRNNNVHNGNNNSGNRNNVGVTSGFNQGVVNGNNNSGNRNNNVHNGNNNSGNRNNVGVTSGFNQGVVNGNNYWGASDNRFNNQENQNVGSRPGNHQAVENNWNVGNKFGNIRNSAINSDVIGNNGGITSNINNSDEVYRPGNHQIIDYRNRDANAGTNYFITSQTSGINRNGAIRPGNHQTIDNNPAVIANNFFVTSHTSGVGETVISRPGNHQMIENNSRGTAVGSNYFVTSHTPGNNRDAGVRPGNHQTIENNNQGTAVGSNYFVTSYTPGNNRDAGVRPGNHQTIENNNRGTTVGGNYFLTSYTPGNNRDAGVRPGNHQTINNNAAVNNEYADSINSESNQDVILNRPGNLQIDGNNQNYDNSWTVNNARTIINNAGNDRNGKTKKNYSNFGAQNSKYVTTENVFNRNNNRYNENNNRYNENNNREFLVANRPWWDT